jgi:hypothetical protein
LKATVLPFSLGTGCPFALLEQVVSILALALWMPRNVAQAAHATLTSEEPNPRARIAASISRWQGARMAGLAAAGAVLN